MTRWTLDAPRAMLRCNDYYKVFEPQYELVYEVDGHNETRNIDNHISIYSSNNFYIAQVLSVRSHNGQTIIQRSIKPEISVATYCEYRGEVVILNRFDAINWPHQNNYDIYPDDERDLYEKYFTDFYVRVMKNGRVVERPCAYTPHFHFNTRAQTDKLGNQDKANAISIDGLIVYLIDLKNCNDKTNPLWNKSLGMPFLDYANNKMEYNSALLTLLSNSVNSLTQSNADSSIVNFMKRLLNISSRSHSGDVSKKISGMKQISLSNIDKIIMDLKLMKRIIANFEHNHEFVLQCAQALMASINNMGFIKEFKYEI